MKRKTRIERTVTKALTDPRSALYFWTNDVLALFTIVSVLGIVLETVPALETYSTCFLIVEWFTVSVFLIEYIARIYVMKPGWRYALSFFGLIDLFSIIPTFVGLGNFTFLKAARIIRLIRLVRMLRMAKIRHLRVRDIDHASSVLTLNITLYALVLVISLLFFGVLFYVLNPTIKSFESIPASIWWTFRVFVNDPGAQIDTSGTTSALYVAARFVGLILLGTLIGVVGNITRHYLLSRQ